MNIKTAIQIKGKYIQRAKIIFVASLVMCVLHPFIAVYAGETGDGLLVPARQFADSIEGKISWNSKYKELDIVKEGDELTLWAGSKTGIMNGKVISLTEPVVIMDGKAMLPLESVLKAFAIVELPSGPALKVDIKDVQEEILTYNKATKLALGASKAHQSTILSKERAEEKNKNLQILTSTYSLTMIQAKKGLELNEKWANMSVLTSQEQIALNIHSKMDKLSLKKQDLILIKAKAMLAREKTKVSELKFQYGQISKLALNDIINEKLVAEQNVIVAEREIDEAYVDLNGSLGLPLDKRTLLEYVVSYGAIGKIDLDSIIRQGKYSDPYIWYADQKKELADFNLKTYDYSTAEATWTSTKLDLSEANLNINSMRDSYAKVVQGRYEQLLLIEANIKNIEFSVEQAHSALYQARIRYDLGLLTELELENAAYVIRELVSKKDGLVQQHGQLKATFEKPYLAPDYASGN